MANRRSVKESVVLENAQVGISLDHKTGMLSGLQNKLTGETYQVADDSFAVEAAEFRFTASDARLESIDLHDDWVRIKYHHAEMKVEVLYTLGKKNHFVEKRMALISRRGYRLKSVRMGQPLFSRSDLRVVLYRYPQFLRKPGEEPSCTYFGRTPTGGFFTGVEFTYDDSSLAGRQVILGYAPMLKIKAKERFECEPVYLGVYRRQSSDREKEGLPLQSESDAMVAMTSAVLGAPRHGLVPLACGWHSEMEHFDFTEESVEADMKSLEVLAECGIDWYGDAHPWGGETEKMNALQGDEKYEIDDLNRCFLERARKFGIKVMMWPTMNNTHPWSAPWSHGIGNGKPFRPDKPEWLLHASASDYPPEMAGSVSTRCPVCHAHAPDCPSEMPACVKKPKSNCMGSKEFVDWLTRIHLEGLQTRLYKAWVMDGDFFGGGGWPNRSIPGICLSDKHDHLPGQSKAADLALSQLVACVRHKYPKIYIEHARPIMDLGVWAMRNADALFTLHEAGSYDDTMAGLPDAWRMAPLCPGQPKNVRAADHIRTCSRIRVHHHFLLHYMDQPLLFPSRQEWKNVPPNWPSEKIEYIMLSAFSCSPNQLYYIPTKTGLPSKDKAKIRKWLDWGRKNAAYLQVRKDLPDWPQAGKVDGSAHIIGDRGYAFLFNPNADDLEGSFVLDESIGLTKGSRFRIRCVHPSAKSRKLLARGQTVNWKVPAQTAVLIEIRPEKEMSK